MTSYILTHLYPASHLFQALRWRRLICATTCFVAAGSKKNDTWVAAFCQSYKS